MNAVVYIVVSFGRHGRLANFLAVTSRDEAIRVRNHLRSLVPDRRHEALSALEVMTGDEAIDWLNSPDDRMANLADVTIKDELCQNKDSDI
jgi:hypothetical protein